MSTVAASCGEYGTVQPSHCTPAVARLNTALQPTNLDLTTAAVGLSVSRPAPSLCLQIAGGLLAALVVLYGVLYYSV